jgi:hypothetical protein
MRKDDFILYCVGCGLKVTKSGAIKDDTLEYGFVKEKKVISCDGEDIPLENLVEIMYRESEHVLTLTYEDGYQEDLHGTKMSKQDAGVLLRQMKMPSCLMEMNAVMNNLFPGIDDMLYFDVLNEQMAFYPELFGIETDTPGKPVMFGDEHVPAYILAVQKRLFEEGYTGTKFPSKEVCLDTLKYRAFKKPRNLFREWLETLVWDGKPRLRRWFIDGLGATAPPLEEDGTANLYLESATEAWFMGVVRRQYEPTKAEVVPVFIGGEGVGKGNFLRYTAGYNDAWFIDTTASLEGPGAEQKFLESIRGRVIVELSESTQFSSPKSSELLKSFVSKTEDQCRKAYAAFQTTSVRRFMLVATSNQNTVFFDTGGGNRRYFPMYCDPNKAILPFDPKYKLVGRDAMEQVWAEAMHMYRTNPRADTFLSKEVAELAAVMQEYGTRENPAVTIIDDWLNDPMNGCTEIGTKISREMIFRNILFVDPGCVPPKSAEFTYNTWVAIQKCWRKCAKTTRVDGKPSSCAYERVRTPEEVKEKRRSNMVNVSPEEFDTFIDVVGIIRTRMFKYGFRRIGDEFPVDGMSPQEIEAVQSAGYIYEYDVGKYRLTMLP